jgi:hypothetical protein
MWSWANLKYCMLGTTEVNRETIGMAGFTADIRTIHVPIQSEDLPRDLSSPVRSLSWRLSPLD